MKINSNYILLGLAVITVVCQSAIIWNLKADKKNNDTSYNTLLKVESEKKAVALQYYLENDAFKLNDPKVYYGNDTSNTFHFFDSKMSGERLVFRFSGLFCDKCVNNLISSLKKAFPEFERNHRIILMSSDINPRIKESYYGKKTLSYVTDDMGLPYESTSAPFFFVVGDDRIAKAIFFPEDSQPEITEKYLRLIGSRFKITD